MKNVNAEQNTAPREIQDFDIIIVGTGSGNTIPAPINDEKTIAIVEKGVFGGTCINVGCIPTKMFVHTADVARSFRTAGKLSLTGSLEHVDWKGIQQRVFGDRIDPIAEGGTAYRAGDETPNITLFHGEAASFVAPRTLRIGDGADAPVIRGKDVVLATGTRPWIHPVLVGSGVRYRTNEDIMRLDTQPESLIILGGGIVAVEFAAIFDALGTKVTVVNRSERLLRKLDAEISEAFTEQAREQWDTHLGVEPRSARETDNGQVELTLDDGTVLVADEILAAQGRISNADTLALEAAGVEKKENGKIKVDEFGRTTAEGVWALGDASNDFDLKHVANQEAKIVQHNLAHPENLRANDYHAVPSGVFTHPQIAVVGMTEADAQATGRELTVKVQRYADVAYGWAMEDTTGFCKVIADRKTGEILGAHIMGPEASTLIQSVVTAMAFGIDARRFATEQYWPHPALTELVENALLGLEFD